MDGVGEGVKWMKGYGEDEKEVVCEISMVDRDESALEGRFGGEKVERGKKNERKKIKSEGAGGSD